MPEYTRRWAAQQFGDEHASEIADLVTTYTRYNSRRKPELLAPETYSLTQYREAETVVADYNALLERAERLATSLPTNARDAFYELVLHPIQASATVNDLYVTVAKNRLYAQQGRASTNELADRARSLFERDAEISRYYNTQLAGGKWRHMMDQTHIGYTYWQEPSRNMMPRVDVIQVPVPAEMGVFTEGMDRPGPPGAPPSGGDLSLPEADPYLRQHRFIEIYNKGQTPFNFTVHASEPWVTVTPKSGTVKQDVRLEVTIDWDHAPRGRHDVPISITGPGRPVAVRSIVNNPAGPSRDEIIGFVESNGYVSIEAEHYARAVGSGSIRWERIPDFGRTLSGMTTAPGTSASQARGGDSPRLEYPVFLFDSGTVELRAYVSPTLNFSANPSGLRYAVSIDDEAPQVVNSLPDTSNAAWEKSVAENIRVATSRHRVSRSGPHMLKFWMVDPGVVVQRLVIDAGGLRPSYLGPPESYHRLPR